MALNPYQVRRLLKALPTRCLVEMMEIPEFKEEIEGCLLNDPDVEPIRVKQMDELDYFKNWRMEYRDLLLEEYIIPLPDIIPVSLVNVSTFSPFGKNLRWLTLSWLKINDHQIEQLGSLGTLTKVSMQRCYGFSTIAPLGGVRQIGLEHVHNIDLGELEKVKEIRLDHCWKIREMNNLTHVARVVIDGTPPESIETFKGIHTLILSWYLRDYDSLVNSYDFTGVREVSLINDGCEPAEIRLKGKRLPITRARSIRFIGSRDDLPASCELIDCMFDE